MKTLEYLELLNEMTDRAHKNESMWEIIKYAQDKLIYKSKPAKPKPEFGNSDPTAEQLRLYADALENYNVILAEYEKEYIQSQEHNSKVYQAIEEFIKDQSNFYKIPEKYQSKVWSYAWDKGHSNGYSEIYIYLCQLAYIFED